MRGTDSRRRTAFTLIEILVVIGIIAILAGLLLPAIARGKRHTRITVCLNNLHQMGIGTELFLQDHGKYPTLGYMGGHEIAPEFACEATDEQRLEEMRSRPLYPYIKPSEVFHCPEDMGKDFSPDGPNYGPSLFYAFGCSYQANLSSFGPPATKHFAEPGLAGQSSSSVRQPSKYILYYEPPAFTECKLVGDVCSARCAHIGAYFHWHFYTGPTMVIDKDLSNDKQKFISPILFVDGHAAHFDFTKALKTEPEYPFEETADWMWYQPLPDTNVVVMTPP